VKGWIHDTHLTQGVSRQKNGERENHEARSGKYRHHSDVKGADSHRTPRSLEMVHPLL
jgi:hypothetical protein